ncbi:hypothetical protein D3C84_948160 [compost metagenome]
MAMDKRSQASSFINWKKPWPGTPPSRFSLGTRTSSKNSMVVSCACRPTLRNGCERLKPARSASTRISEVSWAPLPVLPVLATTTTMSQLLPLEMKVLAPLMTYSSPSSTARVLTACRSEPVSGSVMATAPMAWPAAIFGSQACFCASLPKFTR